MSQTITNENVETDRRALSDAEDQRNAILAEEASLDSEQAFNEWHSRSLEAKFAVTRAQKKLSDTIEAYEAQEHEAVLNRIAEQRSANQRLAERIRREGAPIVDQIRSLLRDLAAADVETARLNAALPGETQPIQSADVIARHRFGKPEEIISEDVIDLWVNDRGEPISDQTAVVAGRDGLGRKRSASLNGPIICYRRRFRVIEHFPAVHAERVEPLYKCMTVPFFDRPGYLWRGSAINSAAQALQALEGSTGSSERRVAYTKYIPVDAWNRPR